MSNEPGAAPLQSTGIAVAAPRRAALSSRLAALLVIFFCGALTGPPVAEAAPVRVEVANTDRGYVLLRDGQPYTIRGAGMVNDDIERFVAHGGNSIRTWTTRSDSIDIRALLDSAQAHGVTVALTLPMRAERHGFDYDDPQAVAGQLADMREDVRRFRDHPALLLWIIGNELNHSYSNPAVWDAVGDVAAMIEELDPNHPATTALSGFYPEVVQAVRNRAPALDFISFQNYGSLFGLPEKMATAGFDEPFMVTEWGTLGYWDMEQTPWGAPVELDSSAKAGIFARALGEIFPAFEDRLLGQYAFFWDQKQERTPTWFGLLLESGETTEAVDVLQQAWTGEGPANRAPRVETMTLDGAGARDAVVLSAGETAQAAFIVTDPDGDALAYRWELRPESQATQAGGDFEAAVPTLSGLLSDTKAARTTLTAPEPGNYRLFAYAYDGQGHAAHANIPFRVEGELVQAPEDLVAGEVMALAYSGFREGQHPDRGDGAINPSEEEILEDLELLVAHGYRLIRMYDAGENTRTTLELIRRHGLPMQVLVGAWLKAEVSNHEGCPWLDEPVPEEELAANTIDNAAEIDRAITLAREFDDIVVAVNVGNEALVEWNDHMVPLEQVIAYVRQVKAAIEQPVTVADNYAWWISHGARLAAEVDFLGVHTYPAWEEKTIDEALAYTLENLEGVRAALPNKPIAVLEAGWATTASEFGARASEANQLRYYRELRDWAEGANVSVFFFEAFDEPWKGDPGNPLGAEKHWGLFFVDRTPKAVLRASTAHER